MKLADDALIKVIEIFRQGLMENKDISDLLRYLDLEVNDAGRLAVSMPKWEDSVMPETD